MKCLTSIFQTCRICCVTALCQIWAQLHIPFENWRQKCKMIKVEEFMDWPKNIENNPENNQDYFWINPIQSGLLSKIH